MHVRRIVYGRGPGWTAAPPPESPVLPAVLLALLIAGLGWAMSCRVDPAILLAAYSVG